jgi:Fe-S-cluster containining protein
MNGTFNICYKCGDCCKKLSLFERLKISWRGRTLMLSKNCKFLDKNNLCKIYNQRPNLCKNWQCEKFKENEKSQKN